jgi:hypothetical protein
MKIVEVEEEDADALKEKAFTLNLRLEIPPIF